MKRSLRLKRLENNNGDFVGFSLEADTVGEHERGIESILKLFNIKGDGFDEMGISYNKDSKSLMLVELDNGFVLLAEKNIFNNRSFGNDYLEEKLKGGSSWDSCNFAIYSDTKEDFEKLIQAEKNNDLSVGLYGNFDLLQEDKGLFVIIGSLNLT